jgi:hypothetical protein
VQPYASVMSGSTNTVMLRDPGLKKLSCPHRDKIYTQNEARRQMGCGVRDPPKENKIKTKILYISSNYVSTQIMYICGLFCVSEICK